MLGTFLSVEEKPVQLLKQFLKLLQVPVSGITIKNTLLSHPDYPSLLSISDALHSWDMDNKAIQVTKDDWTRLTTPWIAYTQIDGENAFAVVASASREEVKLITDSSRKIVISPEKFLNDWSGIALIAEKKETSGEANYAISRQKEQRRSLLTLTPVLLGLLFAGVAFLLFLPHFPSSLSAGYLLLLLNSICGIIITSLLLWYEVDKANPALQKICTAGARTNCSAILHSRQSKVFRGLSWSEAGFFYFTGGYISLLVSGFAVSLSLLNVVALMTIAVFPYTLFSIYYQWRIARQWCPMCLAVQAVFFLEALTSLATGILPGSVFPLSFFTSFLLYLLIIVSVATAWYLLKAVLLQNQESKKARYELARLKASPQIFEALLAKQKQVIIPPEEMGITIGNPQAEHTVIKVCNPYCGPCAKAHPEIERLVEENENLKVQIIFTASNDGEDVKTPPVKHLLAIAGQADEALTRQALDDWYEADVKSYQSFAEKYPVNGELKKQDAQVEAMHQWCSETEIAFTPTFFVDGFQLPDVYSIGDIKYLLR